VVINSRFGGDRRSAHEGLGLTSGEGGHEGRGAWKAGHQVELGRRVVHLQQQAFHCVGASGGAGKRERGKRWCEVLWVLRRRGDVARGVTFLPDLGAPGG
jgi:hypothetical protein